MSTPSVSLVSMPWHLLGSPCIQIGTLEAVLQQSSVECRSHSFYLEFQDFLIERSTGTAPDLTLDEYGDICTRWQNLGVGDWIFALPPLRHSNKEHDEHYTSALRRNGVSKRKVERLRRLRRQVPDFLARCADEILESGARVVGFTTTYSQTWPSAALAHRLKELDPTLHIVFGGANCEGPMGPALLEAFPAIDVVSRGEAEGLLPELMRGLLEERPLPKGSGLCFRRDGQIVEDLTLAGPRVTVDELPLPVYDEYFERLAKSRLAQYVLPQIPFESSRGCWWGMKAHCTFCGINGMDMKFRSKSPERVFREVSTLAARHGVLDFTAVDNILDMSYFESLLPRLREAGHDFSFFYETKANLTEDQVRSLESSGVRTIQPGIESLSTPVLKIMKKGVTALQNIRLLKWCAQHGVHVIWNLLYGFPDEPPEEYARMAQLAPSLFHLPAPSLGVLMMDRFSPYHDRPADFGLCKGPPLPYYRLLYELDETTLADLAQACEYTHEDGRDPESYVGPLREQVAAWNQQDGALTYRDGPGFLVITDTRAGVEPARYTLGEAESAAYLACDAGATEERVARQLEELGHTNLSRSGLRELLNDLRDARLVYEEEGKYLSLAVSRHPSSSINAMKLSSSCVRKQAS